MATELDTLLATLQEHLGDLVSETKRLQEENTYLIEENRRLREELTVYQLRSDIDRMDEMEEIETKQLAGALPEDARKFYFRLPERLTFSEYFRIAESAGLSDERARSFLTLFLKERLVQQVGRRIQKRHVNRHVELTT